VLRVLIAVLYTEALVKITSDDCRLQLIRNSETDVGARRFVS